MSEYTAWFSGHGKKAPVRAGVYQTSSEKNDRYCMWRWFEPGLGWYQCASSPEYAQELRDRDQRPMHSYDKPNYWRGLAQEAK